MVCDAKSPTYLCCDWLVFAQVYAKIQAMWSAVVEAALPYMQHQASARHFEFFGIDVIADCAGQVWLIEANRCGSSQQHIHVHSFFTISGRTSLSFVPSQTEYNYLDCPG